MKICDCCGKKIEEPGKYVCDYCGYSNPVMLMDTDINLDDQIINYKKTDKYKQSQAYFEEILSKITDFSIIGYEYGFNKENSLYECKTPGGMEIVFDEINSGVDCFDIDNTNKICWSDKIFGQGALGKKKEVTLNIGYLYDGVKVENSVIISPVQCDDYWKIGFSINNDRQLTVYLGNENKYTKSSPVNINFANTKITL